MHQGASLVRRTCGFEPEGPQDRRFCAICSSNVQARALEVMAPWVLVELARLTCTPAASPCGNGRVSVDWDTAPMPFQDRRTDRSERMVARSLVQVGDDLREARFQAGLSQQALGATIGLSHSSISRIERGEARDVPYRTIVRVAGQLGMDVPLRAYPRGDPIRDRGQIDVLRRVRALLPPDLGW
jgi:ribosome-binding protein aMBF1 (putative translation factor)